MSMSDSDSSYGGEYKNLKQVSRDRKSFSLLYFSDQFISLSDSFLSSIELTPSIYKPFFLLVSLFRFWLLLVNTTN